MSYEEACKQYDEMELGHNERRVSSEEIFKKWDNNDLFFIHCPYCFESESYIRFEITDDIDKQLKEHYGDITIWEER